MNTRKDRSINPADLPENETFTKKEHYQHPQPADTGKPLDDDERNPSLEGKENNRASKEEGLNEEKSRGEAGAFEGFENHGNQDE